MGVETYPWLLGNVYIFAYCGLVANPHLAAKIQVVAPLPTSTKYRARAWNLPRIFQLAISTSKSSVGEL